MNDEKLTLVGEKLDKLNGLLDKQNKLASLWMTFLRGILNAIGWVVGIAILLSVIALLVSKFSETPILGDFVNFLKAAATRTK